MSVRFAALIISACRWGMIVGLLLHVGGVLAPLATAATFNVTKIADTQDGSCDADCSLREAIRAANASPGADVVALPAGVYTITIAGNVDFNSLQGDLDILDDLEIQGAGVLNTIIDAAGLDRALEIDPLASDIGVTLRDLTIQGGSQSFGGGLFNRGTLLLDNCVVKDNNAENGGGIQNVGTLTLTDSTLSGNAATTTGSLTNGFGGGLHGNSVANLANSTFSGNTATVAGGGISTATGGALSLDHVTLVSNTATSGSALYQFSATTTIHNTLVAGSCNSPSSTVVSQGGNLESPGDSCELVQISDQTVVADAGLAGLANNGGPTNTHALLAGSPALDAGVANCSLLDQRGRVRPVACDTGAFELPEPTEAVFASLVTLVLLRRRWPRM